MGWWHILLVCVGVVIAAVVAWGMWRSYQLTAIPGSFHASYLRGGRWKYGVVHFGAYSLSWFPIPAFGFKAVREWERAKIHDFSYVSSRSRPGQVRATFIYGGTVDDAGAVTGGTPEVLFSDLASISGVISWIEAAPPAPEPTAL